MGWTLALDIKELDELHEVRTKLRELFGTWQDALSIGVCGESAWATWTGKTEPVTITLWRHINDFPISLMNPGCRFVQDIQITAGYHYVCERKEADEADDE